MRKIQFLNTLFSVIQKGFNKCRISVADRLKRHTENKETPTA